MTASESSTPALFDAQASRSWPRTPTIIYIAALLALSRIGEATELQQAGEAPYTHPAISIVGLGKCGTSHLYRLLRSHPRVIAVGKEWCPSSLSKDDLDTYARSLTARFWELMASTKRRGAAVSLNSCINTHASLEYFKFVTEAQTPSSDLARAPKFIFLIREPADLLWASFNFWTNHGDIEKEFPGRWTTNRQYRSPSYFHELLLAEGRIQGSYNITDKWLEERYRLHDLEALIGVAGRQNVMVVDNSRLEARDFLDDLARFTGLGVMGFNRKIAGGRTNVGFAYHLRGAGKSMQFRVEPGIYQVSGFTPMRDDTRNLIHRKANSFCQRVHRDYGVEWRDCLAATGPETQAVDSTSETKLAIWKPFSISLRTLFRPLTGR